jgi:hypothetical protein
MLLGGPFSFLAGLFCLGASGVMKVAEDVQIREREKELSKHNYLPIAIQHELELHVYAVRSKFSTFGYVSFEVIRAIEDEMFVSHELARNIFVEGTSKMATEMLGYEYNLENTKFKVPNIDVAKFPSFLRDEFKIAHYNEILQAKTIDEYNNIPHDFSFIDSWDSFFWPYTFSMKYVQRGELQGISYTGKLGALESQYIQNGRLKRLY